MSPRALLAAAAAVLMLAPAGAAATSGAAAAPIPRAKLALMPLPQSSYGKDGAALEVDPEGGVATNAEVADDSGDKKDTAASLKALGRITGYEVLYGNFGLIGTPGRLVFAASDVELYRDGRAATRGFERNMDATMEDDPSIGVKLLSTKTFPARGIGDRAEGVRLKARLGKATVWMTGVQLRRGPLLASVAVMRTDGSSQDARVLALARALETRIAGVLAGRITTPPAKIPQSTAEPAPKAVKPTVDIAAAALAAGDLGRAEVVSQGHIADESAVSSYEREFESVRYGASRMMMVENGVSLLSSAAQAKASIAAVPSILDPKSDAFRKELAREFAKDGGLRLEGLTVLRQGSTKLGNATAYQITMRVETAIGAIDVAYVFVASGRFLGYLTIVSEYNAALSHADVTRLSGKFADRMRTAAKKLSTPIA